jgi:opacity protein-like surface antigen
MKKITSSIITTLVVSSFAFAGGEIQPVEPVVEATTESPLSGFYVGAGYSYITGNGKVTYFIDDITIPGNIDSASKNGYTLIAGVKFNEYLALEGRYTSNIGKIKVDAEVNGTKYPSEEMEGKFSNLGIYLKPILPVNEQFSIYGLLGYGQFNNDGEKLNSVQYGVGASMAVNNQWSIFADYSRLADDSGTGYAPGSVFKYKIDYDALTFGVAYRF